MDTQVRGIECRQACLGRGQQSLMTSASWGKCCDFEWHWKEVTPTSVLTISTLQEEKEDVR